MRELEVHPAAECVRLMDDEELASLTASIADHGLRDPIILGRINGAASEMLIDGRNRLRACELAGVEPRFNTIEFTDDEAIKAFVQDKTEHRNISKGQKAMRLALLWPEPDKRGRGNKGKALETGTFSRQRLQQARSVLAYSRELALAVRDGNEKLDKALEEVQQARKELTSGETMLAQLRINAPDLADLVDEDRMKLSEASAAFEERKREEEKIEQAKRETAIRVASEAYGNILALGVPEFAESLFERLKDKSFRADLLKYIRPAALESSSVNDGAAMLIKLIDALGVK